MNLTQRLAAFIFTVGVLLGCGPSAQASGEDKPAAGIAVVELFTSEGCSSCPPADAAIGEFIRESKGKPVYVLAFHVDYWNRLGWADPFSQKAFSDRQSDYRQMLRLDSVYTPQAVVNGRVEFVGSDRSKLKAAVAAALAMPAAGTVAAVVTYNAAAAKATVSTTNLPPGTLIRVAVVQAMASTDVPRGENGGRTLRHDHVVRAFASAPLDESGRVSAMLTAPAGGWPKDGSVVVYAQRPSDGQILAATEVAFRE